MKIVINEEKKLSFEPIKATITIESIEELSVLRAINGNTSAVLDKLSQIVGPPILGSHKHATAFLYDLTKPFSNLYYERTK